MATLFDQEIIDLIIRSGMKHFAHLSDISTELGIIPTDHLKALGDGYPREAALTAGLSLEKLLHVMWREKRPDAEPTDDQLFTLIRGLDQFIDDNRINHYMHAIRLTRNRASHIGSGVTIEDAVDSINKLITILEWYSGTRKPIVVLEGSALPDSMEDAFLVEDSKRIFQLKQTDLVINIVDVMEPKYGKILESCIAQSNSCQDKVRFQLINDTLANKIKMATFRSEIKISSYLSMMENLRAEANQHEAKILVFVNNFLIGTVYSNLFAGRRSENGVGVVTTCNVEGMAIPPGKLDAYFEYMLAKAPLDALNPHHEYHSDSTRPYCVYDYKVNKEDIVNSMRSRPLCDDCRTLILQGKNKLDADMFGAIDKLFALSGRMLDGVQN